MTSATDELRRLLDERGVEWCAGEDEYDRKTHWGSNGLTWEYFNDENGDAWLGFLGACESDVTPEQAIDATLGRGTCEVIGFDDGYDEGLDGDWFALAPATWFLSCDHEAHGQRPSYCPVCGRKVKEG